MAEMTETAFGSSVFAAFLRYLIRKLGRPILSEIGLLLRNPLLTTERLGVLNGVADQYLSPSVCPKALYYRTAVKLAATNQLVETVDNFVAVQSLLLQQGSTSLNTPRVSH
jgi:hypothetical protein